MFTRISPAQASTRRASFQAVSSGSGMGGRGIAPSACPVISAMDSLRSLGGRSLAPRLPQANNAPRHASHLNRAEPQIRLEARFDELYQKTEGQVSEDEHSKQFALGSRAMPCLPSRRQHHSQHHQKYDL